MKKKKRKIMLIVMIVFLGTFGIIKSNAQLYKPIRNFHIVGQHTQRTEEIQKLRSDKRYVVNLDGHSGFKINAATMLVNRNGEWRNSSGKFELTYEGTRNLISNFGKASYYYALDIKRQYDYDEGWYLNGSWSVDPKEYEN